MIFLHLLRILVQSDTTSVCNGGSQIQNGRNKLLLSRSWLLSRLRDERITPSHELNNLACSVARSTNIRGKLYVAVLSQKKQIDPWGGLPHFK